jgi:hypothetical protein
MEERFRLKIVESPSKSYGVTKIFTGDLRWLQRRETITKKSMRTVLHV